MIRLRSDLDTYVMPRVLTDEQANEIGAVLSGHNPGITVEVFVNAYDREATPYASQLSKAIKKGGWNVHFQPLSPWDSGVSANHNNGTFFNYYLAMDEGVAIRTALAGPPPNGEDALQSPAQMILDEAFQKGGIARVGRTAMPNRGQDCIYIEVGKRPLEITNPTLKSKIGDWILRNWIFPSK